MGCSVVVEAEALVFATAFWLQCCLVLVEGRVRPDIEQGVERSPLLKKYLVFIYGNKNAPLNYFLIFRKRGSILDIFFSVVVGY